MYCYISLDAYKSKDQIHLYDIVAYKHDDLIIVHIAINDNSKGYSLTLRGDVNNASLPYERELKEEDIIGVYNGFKNEAFGYTISFLQSYMRIITISLFIVLMLLYNFSYDRYDKTLTKRYEYLLSLRSDKKIKNKDQTKIPYKDM